MQREILLTHDGSHTISVPHIQATYHSHHGAIGESRHVYIEAGLLPLPEQASKQSIYILEIGFGTGLNALLTLKEAMQHKQSILYTGVELFPLTQKEAELLNYGELLGATKEFRSLHEAIWERPVAINEYFTLCKKRVSLLSLKGITGIDCIYFDAFSPVHQPELWTEPVFSNLFGMLKTGGILVTYSSKSTVRKAMTAAGFIVEKIPGPWGKREMVRAKKS